MNERTNGRLDEWTNECKEWINVGMNWKTNDCINERIDGKNDSIAIDERTSQQSNECIN